MGVLRPCVCHIASGSCCCQINSINTVHASNHFSLSQQVQPRTGPFLWWTLGQWRRHLCLPGSDPPWGSHPGGPRLHLVWLGTVHSDPPVPASGPVPAPGASQGSGDPFGCRQTGGLPGLPMHHLHHSQTGPLRTQPQAGQEDKGSGSKWNEQEKRCYSCTLKLW